MRVHPEDARSLIPEGTPPLALIGREVLSRIELGRDEVRDDALVRSALWTVALQTAFDRSGLWLRVPGYDTATYGFVDLDGQPSFGVTVHTSGSTADRDFATAPLEVGDRVFPVVINGNGRGRDHLYAYPPEHPSAATAACWTVAAGAGQGPYRLLTAGHVLQGLSVGDAVGLTHGSLFSTDHNGLVAQFGPPRVDAGLIELTGACHQPAGQALTVRRLVAPGTPAYFRGQNSGVTQTMVREVSNPRVSVDKNYANVEFLVLLGDAGSGGDSGALVLADDGSDDVLALYLGEADDINGTDTYGRCQLMRQVELCLDVDLVS
jgi:hypothetical protein